MHEIFGQRQTHLEADLVIFRRAFKPVLKAPALGRTNGMGSGLYGWLQDKRLERGHIKIHFVSILWLPVLPLSAYVVEGFYDEFRVYQKINLWNLLKIYKLRVLPLYFTAIFEGAGLMTLFISLMAAILGGVNLLKDYF